MCQLTCILVNFHPPPLPPPPPPLPPPLSLPPSPLPPSPPSLPPSLPLYIGDTILLLILKLDSLPCHFLEKKAVAQEPPLEIQELVVKDNSRLDEWIREIQQVQVLLCKDSRTGTTM